MRRFKPSRFVKRGFHSAEAVKALFGVQLIRGSEGIVRDPLSLSALFVVKDLLDIPSEQMLLAFGILHRFDEIVVCVVKKFLYRDGGFFFARFGGGQNVGGDDAYRVSLFVIEGLRLGMSFFFCIGGIVGGGVLHAFVKIVVGIDLLTRRQPTEILVGIYAEASGGGDGFFQ